MNEICLFWFRRDLRLFDNRGLARALQSGYPVLPVFIFDRNILDKLQNRQDARLAFIHQTLSQLKKELNLLGSDLLTGYGTPEEAWSRWIGKYPVKAIYTNEDYEPYARERDEKIARLASEKGISFHSFKDHVIFAGNEVVKENGEPYVVYTPYSKAWKSRLNPTDLTLEPSHELLDKLVQQEPGKMISLTEMGFEPGSIHFPPAEVSQSIIKNYHANRDFPSVNGTSRLSLHFRFGTVSIREKTGKAMLLNEKFLNELIWREFYQQILWHFPQVIYQAFKPAYDRIIWRNNLEEFERWKKGETGYPIVDAGMRELQATGFMHNRVRMIVASFLTKHLLIDWRWGEAYFAEKLLDYELASNNGGWQWAAGCGVDAAPYFRVFNPTLQTEKFDPRFEYIKKWVPEFNTGKYPPPMVDHSFARTRCLETYKTALDKG